MSLTTILNPLAAYKSRFGEVRIAGVVPGRAFPTVSTVDAGLLPREQVRFTIAIHTSVCTSFWHYASLPAAWAAFKRHRERLTPLPPRPTLRELLVAEGLSDERVTRVLAEAQR